MANGNAKRAHSGGVFACLRRGALFAAALTIIAPVSVLAQDASPAAAPSPEAAAPAKTDEAAPKVAVIPILLARELREEPLPLSLLDLPPKDLGLAGAKLAITDNNTTGRFMNQEFTLEAIEDADPAKLIADVVQKVDAGMHFVLVDASPATLLKLSDALKGKEALLINYALPDDSLREEDCRADVLHTAPTRSMLADALAQYLVWKKWNRWLLVLGPSEKDKLYADAIRRAAKRFGAKIVEERTFTYDSGNRRSDGGFEQVQQQIPTFTQSAPDYDVVVVADESSLFGDYLPYRTWDARPVAGTAGLVAESWHPAIELWGGTQFQNRFKRLADRNMRPIDYNAWLGVRMIGEAAARTKSTNFKELVDYIKGPSFEVAGFKGVGLSVRNWNGQLRQPILVDTPKMLVTVSPQQGFLHQTSVLDTLGVDKPETKCKAYTQ
ncbi:ABC transporter substrate-binding protein [Hyphomicrobium sp. NDB2Meth4]|uniref:ABC transporter substrate-binding protein n=1 Tax=Hyphomicrobium sp. NDB2Meth4 TaxID=1892846 RepID=UPI0009F84FD0|nr:ABC transporter substrate-binding protein [Hyphomicrobium sp. NDB2Meth4]